MCAQEKRKAGGTAALYTYIPVNFCPFYMKYLQYEEIVFVLMFLLHLELSAVLSLSCASLLLIERYVNFEGDISDQRIVARRTNR
jgi:hypothetical protein